MGSIPGSLGLEDPLKEEISTHSSILAMDRGAGQTTVHGIAKRRMQLSNWTLTARIYNLKILSKLVYKFNDISNTSAIFLIKMDP